MKVFFTCLLRDKRLRDALQKHFRIFKRQNVIQAQSERKITTSAEWEGERAKRIAPTTVILLLVKIR